MNNIYRLRPSCDLTLEELKEPYLWFSRPTEYKDVNDSNIFSFIEDNESIKSSFERIYKDYREVANLCELTGICCFTRALPDKSKWKRFPKGHDGVFIEYDKEVLENHFIDVFGLGNCFKEVEYLSDSTLFDYQNKYNILWEKGEDSQHYKSLREIEKNPKLLDQLFMKMFTRINNVFSHQDEARVILGGRNIPDKSKNVKGYKIEIPKKAIRNVYTHPRTPKTYIVRLKMLSIPVIEVC